jgi:hypothetical protein
MIPPEGRKTKDEGGRTKRIGSVRELKVYAVYDAAKSWEFL